MKNYLKRFASLKVSVCLLVAFMFLIFWAVIAQANAEASGLSVESVVERFFGSYFIWALGYVPLPAFKSLTILGIVHLFASLAFRMPRFFCIRGGWHNLGLYGMHVALLILFIGSLLGSSLKQEYNGFAVKDALLENVHPKNLIFFAANDSLGNTPVKIPILSDESGEGVVAEYPYYLQYRGYIEMNSGKNIVMYKATFDPLHFIPYFFMILFFLSAIFHFMFKVGCTKKNQIKSDGCLFQEKKGISRICKSLLVSFLFFGMIAINPVNTMASDVREEFHEKVNVLLSNPVLPVFFNGEVHSFDSFARGALDEISGKVHYNCMISEAENCPRKMPAFEVVRNMVISPKKTAKYKIFKVLRSDVLEALRLPQNRYISYEEILSSRSELEIYASRSDSHPATLEMKRLYKNVCLYESITNIETFRDMAGFTPLADSSTLEIVVKKVRENTSVNEKRLLLEFYYHKSNLCLWAFIFSFLCLVLSAVNLLLKQRKLDIASNMFGLIATLTLCILFVLRLYIANRVPLANLYEIILMIALLLEGFEVGSFFFCKKRTITLMFPITFVATLLLFFAKFILEPGNTFQAIPAVLNSSVFLTIHVFTIALGFAAMILSGIVSHLYLFYLGKISFTSSQKKNIEKLLYATLIFGGLFTILGTLLGGVWADFAWGRFWGFDPKECGALFVCLWAMLALHLRSGHIVSERFFAIFNSFNIIVTFMCWFGINLLGVGLHSYGFQNGTALWLFVFVAIDIILIVFFAKKRWK